MSVKIIDNLHPEDNAMLQSLYSRSKEGVEEHLEKVAQVGSGKFMEQYYVGYNHASIGDCGTTTIYIEGMTMLAAKAIQDWPLYSGQEKSTRYIDFTEAEFYDPSYSEEGRVIQEVWRRFYISSKEQVVDHLRQKYPQQEGEKGSVWRRAIDARAFDILRGFLPAGATTNLSWHTNLRQAKDHLEWMFAHPDTDIRDIAMGIYIALRQKYPHTFPALKVGDPKLLWRTDVQAEHGYYCPHPDEVDLSRFSVPDGHVDWEPYAEVLAARPRGAALPPWMAQIGRLQSFFTLDFGSYRDLQRHRNGIIRMPLLCAAWGMHPWYIDQLPPKLQYDAELLVKQQTVAIHNLRQKRNIPLPQLQNYYAMGFQVPCWVTQPINAFIYRLELRSSKTVHPTLRQVTLAEVEAFRRRYPTIALHADTDPDDWTVRRGKQTIENRERD